MGFSQLAVHDYIQAACKLRPNIVVGLGDIPYGAERISTKKVDKINGRTLKWMTQQLEAVTQDPTTSPDQLKPSLFAPILPIPISSQKWYLDHLISANPTSLSGLAIYDPSTLAELPPELSSLPRLCFTTPRTPHQLLHEISLGADIPTIPFITEATDAGIALSFTFPAPVPAPDIPLQCLGIDMWSPTHATALAPLTEGCKCYTCTTHHRAYIQHLLNAKEMLGWILLQMHNHDVLERFFAGVRASIAGDVFESDRKGFERVYEPELPAKTGMGPRVRGYQFKSEGPGEVKRNPAAYKSFGVEEERAAE